MPSWLRYVLAFVVFAHGFVYARVGAALPRDIPQWTGRSRLLGNALTGPRLIVLSRVLHVSAGILILACALALAFAHPSWRGLAVAGAVVGLIAFAVFWDGQVKFLAEEGVIGVGASLALLAWALFTR